MYKKRSGTSGIRGQLYETKLISLIHFRAKFDDHVKQYQLATNVDEVGAFDDICFKAKVKVEGRDRAVAVFIQAKHREGDKVLTLNSKNDLAKYFDSYLTIRRAFKPDSKNILFKGNFDETDCLFVMYTTAKDDLNNIPFESDFAPKLNSLIKTGANGLQPCYKDEDVKFLCEIIMKEQFVAVAEQMAKFLSEEGDSIMSMNDDLVLLYHIILVEKVIDVSEIQFRNEEKEHRIASFRQDFFKSDEEFLISFKDTLYIEMLKRRKLEESEVNTLLTKFFDEPFTITTFSKLIVNVITYNNKIGKLEFVSKSMPEDLKRRLDKVNVLQSTVDEAIESAAKAILETRLFKVLAAFGNKDLTIRGKIDVKVESILDNLKMKIVNLIHQSPPENIIIIDQSLGDEFLQLNAGIAGAVGNILVLDQNTRLLKFTEECDLLGDLAKRLFAKVQSEIQNLHEYRFRVEVNTFPKLSFEKDDDEDIDMLREQVTTLAELIGEFICKQDDSIMSMEDKLVLRYHVILAQKVIDVSEIQCINEDKEHRIASFRQDFFENNEEFVKLLKDALYVEVLKKRKLEENEINNLLLTFLSQPSEITVLSKLIETVFTYKNGKFEFINDMPKDLKQQLDSVNVPQSTVNEGINLAAKEIVKSKTFKVLAAFGNKDLTIRGVKGIKIESRLNHLKTKIAELMKNANPENIVTLDESLGDGLLKLSGGISGLVGNMLVPDENTKLMKFTENWDLLGELAKRLIAKLKSEIPDLHEYKFDVKVKKFPKLLFERSEHDENLVKDFLKKLLFYTNQADESGVEEFLKSEIEDRQCHNVSNFQVTSDAIFLQYHHEIQKWWMLPKEGPYLTKQSKIYEKALTQIVNKPLMTVISIMYLIKINNNVDYRYNENAINSLKLDEHPPGTIFVTDSSAITVAKMIQYLKNKDHALLDLEYILNLQANEFKTVRDELTKTKNTKILIIVCNNIQNNFNNGPWCKRLENIAKDVIDKRTIIVVNNMLIEQIKTYFLRADNNKVSHESNSLIDMSEDSQKKILQNAKIIFQGIEISLDLIIDETSIAFVKGEVLNKIINNESIAVSKPISLLNYDKIKHLYIDRRVVRVDNLKPNIRKVRSGNVLITLYDIEDEVALITAIPGMGKSTLLTHLSLKTKELNPQVWIVRINLLDRSKEFSKWQENKTVIDTLETLNFMCGIILSERHDKVENLTIELEESNGVVKLKECTGDEWTVFELKMFLHFFNRKELIFLFDGFDEICPTYAHEVVSLLKVVRNYPKKHKMWITSRLYDKAKFILEEEFGISYEIQQFSKPEQNTYLRNYWKSKIILSDLNTEQFNNICNFMEFMSLHYHKFDIKNQTKSIKHEKHQILFYLVCINFLGYLRNEINGCPKFVVDTFNSLFSDCNHKIIFIEDFDTPLHLYLIADYFQNQIKDINKTPNKWNLDINTFTIYEQYFETKLKKIRFQEKNKIDLSNPDNMIIYEKVRQDFNDKHKKLGAYAVFHRDADKILNTKELKEIKETIDNIKNGKEKTGLIFGVASDIPMFIHMTFTEYFAVEYVCDLLKMENSDEKQTSIWDFVLNVMFLKCSENIRNVLSYKIKTEEGLRTIVNENEEIIFDLLLKQGCGVYAYNNEGSKELFLKIKNALDEAMGDELSSFVPLLYKLKFALTGQYLEIPSRIPARVKRLKIMHSLHMKRKSLNQNQLKDS